MASTIEQLNAELATAWEQVRLARAERDTYRERCEKAIALLNRSQPKECTATEKELNRLRALIRKALDEAQSHDGTITGMVRILAAAGRGEGEI